MTNADVKANPMNWTTVRSWLFDLEGPAGRCGGDKFRAFGDLGPRGCSFRADVGTRVAAR